MEFPILSVILFLPLAGGLGLLFFPREAKQPMKVLACAVALLDLALTVWLYAAYDKGAGQMQFMERAPWIPSLGVQYLLGVDGLSLPMVILTALLTFLSLLYSVIVEERVKEYFFLFLLLETGMLGVFLALDLFLFYIFWEVSLVPMYFIIGVWGGPRREYAAIKFFLYTLAGSVLMLLGILVCYFNMHPHTFDMLQIARVQPLQGLLRLEGLVFWAFYIAFAIKIPAFPFHTWLPDAHVEAPTAGSVILAGVLLKMGGYGLLRVSLTFFPASAAAYAGIIGGIALINIVYGSLVALAQSDLKKLIAYSSIGHMGFVMLGVAAASTKGLDGAVLQMFSHGCITGALFLLVGVIYERTHHRDLWRFGGLGKYMPVYCGIFMFMGLASLGLPGLSGFMAELLVLLGSFEMAHTRWMACVAVLGILIAAAYILWTIQRMFLGPPNEQYADLPDATPVEIWSLAPLMVVVLLIGVYPQPLLRPIDASMALLANSLAGMLSP
jgi:NADH-quinone oxidoreductase subunit M